MSEHTDTLLKRMVAAIVKAVDPEQIVLFGSRAQGDAKVHSDFDFLVVVPRILLKKRSRIDVYADVMRHLRGFKVPIDILLYTPGEVREWRPYRNHVISRAFREGRVLYEKAKARTGAHAKSAQGIQKGTGTDPCRPGNLNESDDYDGAARIGCQSLRNEALSK